MLSPPREWSRKSVSRVLSGGAHNNDINITSQHQPAAEFVGCRSPLLAVEIKVCYSSAPSPRDNLPRDLCSVFWIHNFTLLASPARFLCVGGNFSIFFLLFNLISRFMKILSLTPGRMWMLERMRDGGESSRLVVVCCEIFAGWDVGKRATVVECERRKKKKSENLFFTSFFILWRAPLSHARRVKRMKMAQEALQWISQVYSSQEERWKRVVVERTRASAEWNEKWKTRKWEIFSCLHLEEVENKMRSWCDVVDSRDCAVRVCLWTLSRLNLLSQRKSSSWVLIFFVSASQLWKQQPGKRKTFDISRKNEKRWLFIFSGALQGFQTWLN